MKNDRWTKGLIIGLIMLLIGTSIIPGITGSIRQATMESNHSDLNEIQTMCTTTSFFSFPYAWTTMDVSSHSDEIPTLDLMDPEYALYCDKESSITRDAASITQPMNDDVLRGGDLIDIQGTANGSMFQNYIIEWGVGAYPSQWYSTGITLLNGGLIAIVNDTLASWDTGFVTQEGFYTLRLTVNFTTSFNQTYIRNICMDPTLKEGWPQRVPFYYDSQGGSYWSLGYLEPVVADINNDGYGEIIICRTSIPQQLQVYTLDGSLLWSSDIGEPESGNGGNVILPIIDDLNHDGFSEIIVYRFLLFKNYCHLYVFDHNGSVLDGWPLVLPKEYHPSMLCADINLDGYDEIIFKGNDANEVMLSIVDHTGTILSQWQLPDIHWGSSLVATPAVANLDSDPELEIVCGSPSENAGYNSSSGEWINEGYLDVFNLDGSELPGWPKYTDGIIFTSPVIGDINNDGKPEILVGLQYAGNAPDYRYGGLYAYDAAGNVLPGFPFEKGWNFCSAPSIADFDNDGDLEIVASRLGFYTYVLHHDGTLAAGWPQQTTWNDYYSTIIGDINNDNILDIVTTAGNGFYPSTSNHGGVYAWGYDGTPLPGFPKATEVDAQAPACIADIDNDGNVEIIASSNWDYDWETSQYKFRGSLYIWDIDAAYNPSSMPWWTFHHDNQRTGLYPQSLTADANGPYQALTDEPIQFIGNVIGGTPPYSWNWDFGDGATSTEQAPVHSYSEVGTYTVTLIVTDADLNTDSDVTTATITVPQPELAIGNITGGLLKVKAPIQNIGQVAATTIEWNITLIGGFILTGRQTTGTIETLAPGDYQNITSKAIIGFGKTLIQISTTVQGNTVNTEQNATVLLFFIGIK
jgi:hypothetical protein